MDASVQVRNHALNDLKFEFKARVSTSPLLKTPVVLKNLFHFILSIKNFISLISIFKITEVLIYKKNNYIFLSQKCI